MKKKLLITGAFGLVGSTICKILERDYPEIEVKKLKHVDGLIWKEYYSFDYIIHAAGYGQPQLFSKDKVGTIRTNTFCTNFLIEDFLKKDGKFLFISTSEVYSGAEAPYREIDIGTTTPQHSRACYIEGKRCGEAICGAYRELGYDIKIARLALAYGPGTKKGDTRVLNQFIEQALTNKVISMRDKGEAIRTYCYVEDAADMLLNILFKGTQPVYNVGGMDMVSIRGLADMIGKITKVGVTTGAGGLDGAPEEVDMSMALTLTEFPRTFISLEEGLKRTIEYQKQLYA